MAQEDIFVVNQVPEKGQSLADVWNAGIDDAEAIGAEWIFFQEPDVQLNTRNFENVGPALKPYDAIWGGITVDGVEQKLSRFTCDDFINACHMALVWWVGRSHFVRTGIVSPIRFDTGQGDGWFAHYLLKIWQNHRSLKTAQAFVDRATGLPRWSADERNVITDFLRDHPQFIRFDYAGQPIKLPYTGKNPTLERTQLRGVFFEQRELEGLSDVVNPGAVIVDVGANTGNHTVFFARVLKAAKVIPVEPNPETADILKLTVAANGIEGVDLSKLGLGAGETRGQFFLSTGRRGHLGTVQLATEGEIAVDVWPLDAMITEPIDFLKIDVENMEIDVLRGARALIEKNQPNGLVEVQDENIAAFLAILDQLRYRIKRIFADHGYANYLIVPERSD